MKDHSMAPYCFIVVCGGLFLCTGSCLSSCWLFMLINWFLCLRALARHHLFAVDHVLHMSKEESLGCSSVFLTEIVFRERTLNFLIDSLTDNFLF